MTALIILLCVAPVLFWVLGAPILLRRDSTAWSLAPLLGGAVAGLVAEVALATGISARILISVALVVAVLAVLILARREALGSLREAYGCYLCALVPAVLSPFPVVGVWGGDWLYLYQAGRTLWEGGVMSPESLQRPPLFGGVAAPLWLFAEGLIPYQISSAAMSAGALGACIFAGRRFAPQIPSWKLLLPLVLTPFFLHHTAACWGKWMAAGLILAAATELRRGVPWVAAWWAGVWFALAVAVHQSSIIYFPFLLAVAFIVSDHQFAAAARFTGAAALCGLLIVAPYEAWTIHTYGIDAKVAANPAVAQRAAEYSLATNTALITVSSFVGWAPFEHLHRWMQQPDPFALSRIQKEAFWMVTSWVQVLTGTFLGAALPLLLGGGRGLVRTVPAFFIGKNAALLLAGSAFAIFANALLNPFHSSNGTMQTGLTALGVIGLLGLTALLTTRLPMRWSRVVGFTVALGTIPWTLLNMGVSAGLHFSPAFRTGFISGSEGDWERLTNNHLTALGVSGFPLLPLLLLAILVLVAATFARRTPVISCSHNFTGI